jgi:hypothetical protein
MKRFVIVALVLSIGLTGCGRLADRQDEDPAPAPAATEASATSLDDVAALLDAVDGAVTQSESDLSEGQQSESKE